jgi:hypothetical protein
LTEPVEDIREELGAIPLPDSCTSMTIASSSYAQRTSMRPPEGVNLTAFDNTLPSTWCNRFASPSMMGRFGRTGFDQLDVLGLRRRHRSADDRVDERREQHRRMIESRACR